MTEPAAPLIHPLVVAILEKNARESAAATDGVIGNLEWRLKRAETVLALVRDQITALHSGPWMPNPAVVMDALWPTEKLIGAALNAESPAT